MNFKRKLRVRRPLTTISSIVVIILLSVVFQGCEQEEFFESKDEIINSTELEEFILAGIDYQSSLSSFRKELKSIDFSKIKSYKDSNGKIIIKIPSSISIEEKAKIFNEKKKKLLEKHPDFTSISVNSRHAFLQQSIKNSSKINEKMLALGIPFNQPRLKSFTVESFSSNDDVCSFLDAYLTSSNYVEVVVIVFEDGSSMVYTQSDNDSTTCTYPPLVKIGDKWYTSLYSTSAISYIAHTHLYSSNPSTEDYNDYNNDGYDDDYPGLSQAIYTSGCNYDYYY